MSRRIIETFDRLGGLCFKIHLGVPMRIVAARIDDTQEELVVYVEPIPPAPLKGNPMSRPVLKKIEELE
jgi:hypothetical protein